MSSKRKGFIKNLKTKASRAGSKKNIKKKQPPILKAESPLRRDLTEEELLLLYEIDKDDTENNLKEKQKSTLDFEILPDVQSQSKCAIEKHDGKLKEANDNNASLSLKENMVKHSNSCFGDNIGIEKNLIIIQESSKSTSDQLCIEATNQLPNQADTNHKSLQNNLSPAKLIADDKQSDQSVLVEKQISSKPERLQECNSSKPIDKIDPIFPTTSSLQNEELETSDSLRIEATNQLPNQADTNRKSLQNNMSPEKVMADDKQSDQSILVEKQISSEPERLQEYNNSKPIDKIDPIFPTTSSLQNEELETSNSLRIEATNQLPNQADTNRKSLQNNMSPEKVMADDKQSDQSILVEKQISSEPERLQEYNSSKPIDKIDPIFPTTSSLQNEELETSDPLRIEATNQLPNQADTNRKSLQNNMSPEKVMADDKQSDQSILVEKQISSEPERLQEYNSSKPIDKIDPIFPTTSSLQNEELENANNNDSSNNISMDIPILDITLNDYFPKSSNAISNLKNPTLNETAFPESPLLPIEKVPSDYFVEQFDSPSFSPLITEQILQLEGTLENSQTPRTPFLFVPESQPASPSSDFQNSTAPRTPFSAVQNSPATQSSLYLSSQSGNSNNTSRASSPKNVTARKRKSTLKNNPGKKRLKKESEWKDVQRKVKRNSGKAYLDRKGQLREERKMGPTCESQCRLKCFEKIDHGTREKTFSSFWAMGELIRQWDYINRLCTRIIKRRRTNENDSRRQYTILYSLPTCHRTKTKVCKKMFLNTLGIKQGLVQSALNKLSPDGTVAKDKRGSLVINKIKITEEMKSSVCDHVNSFAPIESHYVRDRSAKLYLDGSLSVARMFLLYQEWYDPEKRVKVQTLRQYRDIVNERFNLGFYTPKKDQCDICHIYKNTERPVTLEEHKKYTGHILNKTIARELRDKQKEIATKKQDTMAAVYDFQKVHSLPHAETSVLYYKRKLSIFNFTVYNLGNTIGTCYCWDESVAKRGSNEVSSCLYDFISTYAQKGIRTFYFLSDNCSGQNRNRIVFAAYLRASKDYNVEINHTYLEKGHTQNEGDSVHALIERSAKPKTIYTSDQWYAMIRWCKQNGHPYIVKEMVTSDFLDFKVLLPGCNWSYDVDNNAVLWSQMRQLQILPNESDRIYFKTDFCSHEWKCIIVEKKSHPATSNQSRTRRQGKFKTANSKIAPMHSRRLQQAYQSQLPISKDKLKDLKYLCSQKIIPRQYHAFYDNLKAGEENNNMSEEE